jgi:hypothetical protein
MTAGLLALIFAAAQEDDITVLTVTFGDLVVAHA